MKNIIIFTQSSGGGHNATANAIKDGISRYKDTHVRIIDIREALNDLDPVKRFTSLKVEEVYNYMLRHNITSGMQVYLKLIQKVIKWKQDEIHERLVDLFKWHNPDVVVSVIPNFNWLFADVSLLLHKPFVTVMCDMKDQFTNFWVSNHPHQVLVAPGQGGCVVHPKFYGLDKQPHYNTLVGLVLFGGYGSKEMLSIAKRLNNITVPNKKLFMLFVCGYNQDLAFKIHKLATTYNKATFSYVDNLQYNMQAADFIICKPGPGVLSEAVVTKVPVVTCKKAMWQEKPNVEWVKQEKFGVVLDSFKDIKKGIEEITSNLEYQSNINKLKNRMVWEVCDYLNKI